MKVPTEEELESVSKKWLADQLERALTAGEQAASAGEQAATTAEEAMATMEIYKLKATVLEKKAGLARQVAERCESTRVELIAAQKKVTELENREQTLTSAIQDSVVTMEMALKAWKKGHAVQSHSTISIYLRQDYEKFKVVLSQNRKVTSA